MYVGRCIYSREGFINRGWGLPSNQGQGSQQFLYAMTDFPPKVAIETLLFADRRASPTAKQGMGSPSYIPLRLPSTGA